MVSGDCVIECFQQNIACEELRQNNWLRFRSSPVHDIERNAIAAVPANEFSNHWVVVSPVRNHIGYACLGESAGHVGGEQNCLLIGETGDAPVSGHVHKDGFTLGAHRGQVSWRPGDCPLTACRAIGLNRFAANGAQQDCAEETNPAYQSRNLSPAKQDEVREAAEDIAEALAAAASQGITFLPLGPVCETPFPDGVKP